MILSRRTRVADVAAKLADAEAALIRASDAMRDLRELVETGAGKLAP